MNERGEVLRAARFLYDRRMVNAFEGNVSLRVGGRLLITPSQVCKGELTEDDLVEVDIASGGTVSAKPGRVASSELKVHLTVYRTRPDLMSVCHAHPPAATSFALRGEAIETRGYPELIVLFGRVPVARYGRPSTWSVCDGIPDILRDYDCFLLENHGLVACGPTAMDAAWRLESIESIAEVLFRARLMGGEKPLPPGEAEAINQTRLDKQRR